jgi:putative two-component system response regulator
MCRSRGTDVSDDVARMEFPRPSLADARILVVDDVQVNVALLERILHRAGYTNVVTTSSPEWALEFVAEQSVDLLLLDLHMPRIDGFAVLERLSGIVGAEEYLPVVMITADAESSARQRALALGAHDFLTKPFDDTEVLLRIRNLLSTRQLHLQMQSQNEVLEKAVEERTSALWRAVTNLERAQQELRSSREETIQRLSMAAEFRDEDTGAHIQRMSRYCGLLARASSVSSERADLLRIASQMHDVGKIAIPDNILLKPGALNTNERAVMERHSEIGFRLLSGSESELLVVAASIARSHHERIDGSGYPRGLRGDEIPFEGRVAAICDVFDALTSERVYRPAMPTSAAIAMMQDNRGTHFDADLLDLFVKSLPDALEIRREYTDPVPVPASDAG